MRRIASPLVCVVLLLAFALACHDAGPPTPPTMHNTDRLWIRSTGLVLAPGATVRLGATLADSAVTAYHEYPGSLSEPWPANTKLRWWTSDPSIASIDSVSGITAHRAGRVTAWVGLGSVADSGTVVVETASGGPGFAVSALSGGSLHTCALSTAGLAYCWGSDFSGALGRGRLRQFSSGITPAPISDGRVFTALTVGLNFACALNAAGSAICWGDNQYGQLGDGTDAQAFSEVGGFGRASPVPVLGGQVFTQIRAGGFHVCALDAGGQAFCWGWHGFGQLGTGPPNAPDDHRTIPTPAAVALRFLTLGLGALHSCGVATDSLTYCWGLNDKAQLGIDSSASPEKCAGGWVCSTPIALDSAFRFVSVTAGRRHSCGLTAGGTAYCWGNGSATPQPVAGLVLTALAAGNEHTCGLTSDGTAYCWGSNDRAQLGDGTVGGERPDPGPVATTTKFASLAPAFAHTCGITRDAWASCWGWNRRGQIGNGTIEPPLAVENAVAPAPTPVRAPLP